MIKWSNNLSNLQRVGLSQKTSFYVLNQQKMQNKIKSKSLFVRKVNQFFYVLVQGTKDYILQVGEVSKFFLIKDPNPIQIHRMTQLREESIKFVPFFVLTIIPFSGIILFPYLYYFPNAVPTTYLFEHQYLERIKLKDELSQEKYIKLSSLLKDNLQEKYPKDVKLNDLQIFIRQNKQQIEEAIELEKLDLEILRDICLYFGLEIIDFSSYKVKTRRLINLILKRQQDQESAVNYPKNPQIKYLIKRLLLFQLYAHVEKINREDKAFIKFDTSEISQEELANFYRQRGLIPKYADDKENSQQIGSTLLTEKIQASVRNWSTVLCSAVDGTISPLECDIYYKCLLQVLGR